MDIAWITLDGKPLVTNEGEAVITDDADIKLPEEPPELEIPDDEWETSPIVTYIKSLAEPAPGEGNLVMHSEWARRTDGFQVLSNADIYRTTAEEEIAEVTIPANTWILRRYGGAVDGEWWGRKPGVPNGPTGEYERFASIDDPTPDPETLEVDYA